MPPQCQFRTHAAQQLRGMCHKLAFGAGTNHRRICPRRWGRCRRAPDGSVAVGAAPVVRAPADGHTLLMANSTNAFNATLYDKLKFNFIRDIAPVAGIIRVPLVMEVNPSVPVKTVPEFITYARANLGKISMASAGSGTPLHVSGELFKMMTGVNIVHVPYRGTGPALIDLLGGQVQVMFDALPASIEYVRDW